MIFSEAFNAASQQDVIITILSFSHGISSLSSSAAVSSSSRLRRDAPSSLQLSLNPSDENGSAVIETSSLRQLNRNSNIKISDKDEAELNAVITGDGDIRRNRRDTSGCVVNTKVRRHLWVGCTAPNVIEVRPHCNDDSGDEGKLLQEF